jgi:hypothetical protein
MIVDVTGLETDASWSEFGNESLVDAEALVAGARSDRGHYGNPR